MEGMELTEQQKQLWRAAEQASFAYLQAPDHDEGLWQEFLNADRLAREWQPYHYYENSGAGPDHYMRVLKGSHIKDDA